MAGTLKPDESATKGIRRLACRQVSKALAEACKGSDHGAALSSEVVHSVRKRLKRTRALLRLVRDALGSAVYHRENESYRDAARPLTEVRDAEVLIQTFDQFVRRLGRDPQPLAAIRAALATQKDEACRQVFQRQEAREPICRSLQAGLDRIDDWPRTGRSWSVLASGIKRVYRSGQDACAAAHKSPSNEHLHQWRKQAKYLRYQLEALRPVWPLVIDELVGRMKTLGDRLGEDHDLAVLRARLDDEQAFPERKLTGDLQHTIDLRRDELQQQAREVGEPFFKPRPKVLVAHLEECWHLWRAKPRAMAEA
jgi:CHAD domain-containing protein